MQNRGSFSILKANTFELAGVDMGGVANIAKGNTYYVSKNGSNGNTGTSKRYPLQTIAEATTIMKARIDWAVTPWAKADRMIIEPGLYAENLTSLPYGCDMIGLGHAFDLNGERGVTIKPATGLPVDCTSVINMWIHNICFASPTDAGTGALFQADNFNRTIMTNCFFGGVPGASPTTTRGFEVVKDMTGSIISGCWFLVCRTGIYLVADNANSKQITGDIIENCYITGGDTAGIYFDINCVPSMTQVNNCIINGGGSTLALGIDDNTAAVHVSNCMFEATACDPSTGSGHYNHCYLNGTLLA